MKHTLVLETIEQNLSLMDETRSKSIELTEWLAIDNGFNGDTSRELEIRNQA